MRSAPTIAFDYRASRSLRLGHGLLGVAALAAIAAAALPIAAQIVLVAGVVAAALIGDRSLRQRPFVRLAWHGAGQWQTTNSTGEQQTARLAESRLLGPLIVVTLVLAGGKPWRFVLLADNADAETRRLLRVRLRRERGHDRIAQSIV